MSTSEARRQSEFIVVSKVSRLLAERGVSQYSFAVLTGIRREVLNRMIKRRVVKAINCDVAIRICRVLSQLPTVKERRRVQVRLDQLFPIIKRTGR